jgi:cell division protein FtsQ
MWIGVAAGMVMLITAAMKIQNESVCAGYDVNIFDSKNEQLFISKEEIVQLLNAATNEKITDRRLNEFDLPKIEDLLEQSPWVSNAELYFNNKNILRVNVMEREPVARIFTHLGESFYIDETGRQIPLSEKVSIDVPVFTGYSLQKITNENDSILFQNIIEIASFINTHSFWSSQVSQINISRTATNWQMEMIPVVGNHRVRLGDGSNIADKFHRLYLFYEQVLKYKGFDKYPIIDVQYSGQIIAVKGNETKIDSLQLRKNIDSLLQQSRAANEVIDKTPDIGLSNYIMELDDDTLSLNNPLESVTNDTTNAVSSVAKDANVTASKKENKSQADKKSATGNDTKTSTKHFVSKANEKNNTKKIIQKN